MPFALDHARFQAEICQLADLHLHSAYQDLTISQKPDASLLTSADIAMQHALCQYLPSWKKAPVLGEEIPEAAQLAIWETAQETGFWCVDPIDGTSNFVYGIPYFAVSIAFIAQGCTQLGLVYNPATKECFFARRGQGAFCNQKRLQTDTTRFVADLKDSLAGIEPYRLDSAWLEQLYRQKPFYFTRNFGASVLDYCYLATGRLDTYLHGCQKMWDYAAGALILEEAGGCVGQLGRPMDSFWTGNPWEKTVIAAKTPALFSAWQQVLNQLDLPPSS